MNKFKALMAAGPLLLAGLFSTAINAEHSWGKYHWDISSAHSNTSPLELADNLSTDSWKISHRIASDSWNGAVLQSGDSVLKNAIVPGAGNDNCGPTLGRIEVCNDFYGDTRWLGIASIWATRGKSNHIVQGVVKVNDTYFSLDYYNTDAWRDYVMCQEVGHTFGLDHQDIVFDNANLGSCMDYTNDPDGTVYGQLSNVFPNQHDYDMMVEIYSHLNSTTDGGGGNGKGGGKKLKKADGADIDLNNPSAWGQVIRQDSQGRNTLFERALSNGQVLVTHVIWAY